MKDQHKKITGYRDLTIEEIRAMNDVKALGEELEALVDRLEADLSYNQRWVAIGKTDLQTGLMALVRAIARPTSF